MKKDNMDLISIVFGYDKPTTRNIEALELLRWGFANYKIDKILEKNKEITSFNHILYKDKINIVLNDDLYYLTKKNINIKYKINYDYKIENNNCIGNAFVYIDDDLIGKVNLKSLNKIEKRSFIDLWITIFKKIIV